MFKILFRGKEFTVNLYSEGFKVQTEGTEKWNYISEDSIKKFVYMLNNTKQIKLSVPLDERDAFNLPNDMSIFRNLALIVRLLFAENVKIKEDKIELISNIKFSHELFIEKRNTLINKNQKVFNLNDKVFVADKGQYTLTDFQ